MESLYIDLSGLQKKDRERYDYLSGRLAGFLVRESRIDSVSLSGFGSELNELVERDFFEEGWIDTELDIDDSSWLPNLFSSYLVKIIMRRDGEVVFARLDDGQILLKTKSRDDLGEYMGSEFDEVKPSIAESVDEIQSEALERVMAAGGVE